MVSEFVVGISLALLIGIVSNIWVTQMFRFLDKKLSRITFLISTIVVIILFSVITYLGFTWK